MEGDFQLKNLNLEANIPLEHTNNVFENSVDRGAANSNTTHTNMSHSFHKQNEPQLIEIHRKREYRVGLNFFNTKPENGIHYLVHRGFLLSTPEAVAHFLFTRKGLSKHAIGEYLGDLQKSFNMDVLQYFSQKIDLADIQLDEALRKFQTYFKMPGEAQKIDKIVEVFSHRFIDCNPHISSQFHNSETIFVLSFAIMILNTDLHRPNIKAQKKMKLEEFIRNLRSIDDGHDINREMLIGIYNRIKANEFQIADDHTTKVFKFQQTIVDKTPNLALPHRRLVCNSRFTEVHDIHKKQRTGKHQREVTLFNDILLVTKTQKKNHITSSLRQSIPMHGTRVELFETAHYPYGITIIQELDNQQLITFNFNARNENDRTRFVENINESISEMQEYENLSNK